jgi:putative flippase GtrA
MFYIKYEFFRFCLIGFIGFIIESFLITVIIELLNISKSNSRLVSLPICLLLTWFLNRNYTFFNKNNEIPKQLILYYIFIGGGVTLNFIVYYFSIVLLNNIKYDYILSVAIGSISSMLFNYFNMKFFVFK